MLHSSTFMVRREAMLNGLGLVAEDAPGSQNEDWDMLLRAARRAPIVHVDEPLVQVLWARSSHFAYEYATKISSLRWMMSRHPEIRGCRPGAARVYGQLACWSAASGNKRDAWHFTREAVRNNWREPRAAIAIAAASGVVGRQGSRRPAPSGARHLSRIDDRSGTSRRYRRGMGYSRQLASFAGGGLGEFACPPSAEAWDVDVRQECVHVIAFPGTPVWIRFAGAEPILADRGQVMLHRAGQVYQRSSVAGRGDYCRFIHLTDSTAREITAEFDPASASASTFRFSARHTGIPAGTYASFRSAISAALAAGDPLRLAEV